MCEATAYLLRDDQEELLLEGVDLIEPEDDGNIKLVSIFGEQKVVQARIKKMALVDHKILLEPV